MMMTSILSCLSVYLKSLMIVTYLYSLRMENFSMCWRPVSFVWWTILHNAVTKKHADIENMLKVFKLLSMSVPNVFKLLSMMHKTINEKLNVDQLKFTTLKIPANPALFFKNYNCIQNFVSRVFSVFYFWKIGFFYLLFE